MYGYAIDRLRSLQVVQSVFGEILPGQKREKQVMTDLMNLIEYMDAQEMEKRAKADKGRRK